MFQNTTEEESSEDEEAVWAVQHLRQAVLNDDPILLDHMLCQPLYKRSMEVRGGWGIAAAPLRLAAGRGSLGCVRVLLSHGARVDSVDVKAQTPLFTAVCGRYLECVLALLAAGAHPDGSPFNNCSPLLTAAREGSSSILKLLLRGGAQVNLGSRGGVASSVGAGPLYLSALYGHMTCFRALLLHGADPDYNWTRPHDNARTMNISSRTVLEMCVRHGCAVEYVRLLIDFGANVFLPTLIIEKTTRQNDALELLLRERARPRSLLSQCRLTILSRLQRSKVDRMHCVEQLALPPRLARYLQHTDWPIDITT